MTETRQYNFEIRAQENEEHGHFVEGVPIVFDQKTDLGFYEEYIDSGALDHTDLRDVRFLVNHNTDMIPLARSRNNNENSTMQMSVAEDGMHIRVDLDVEGNTEAKNLYSALSRRDIDGMSFMFQVDGDKWENLDTDYPTRHITSISRVFEVSAVTFPAYEQTSIGVRDAEALDSAKAVLENAKTEAEATANAQERAEKLKVLNDLIEEGKK